ncbi:MAG: metallophosphoesterase [Proteobacteria bacterium]|nr:metallophosphoesterase [Pseudomonadota bacterium]
MTQAIEPKEAVIVTYREVEKVLTGREAVGNITEAANQDSEATPLERASLMAAMGHVLNELRRVENEAGAMVLTTPPHGPATRLQSLIASGDAANLTFAPLPTGGLEAKFDTSDWFGWATVAWEKLKHAKRHDMKRPPGALAEPLPEAGRIAVLGDWGTGLYGAPAIARSVRGDPDPFAVLLHLGDVYYSGTSKEVKQRFLDLWPSRNGAVNRALNSNHEMYSGGDAYFDDTLPAFGQQGSYFAMQNTHWTLIGLDVAYRDHDIDDIQVEWLKQILAKAGERKVVLFSHHQLYSHFDSQGSKLWKHPEFGALMRSKRIFAWYWGHEHRCTIFEGPDRNFGILARCIGHGGMPESRAKTRNLPRAGEPIYAAAEWRRSTARTMEGNALADAVVLEGGNEYIKGEEDKFTPHGYAVLTFDGASLKEQILTPTRQVIYEKVLV